MKSIKSAYQNALNNNAKSYLTTTITTSLVRQSHKIANPRKINIMPPVEAFETLATVMSNTTELTMSSREIAEFTGKIHKNVKRDIRNMLIELELDGLNFGRIYLDSLNRKQTEYRLNRDLTDCLLTGYSAKARLAVIKRWRELEERERFSLPKTFGEALQLAANQAKQLEIAAPKVAFVDNLVDKTTLMNASQVGTKHKISAIKLNRFLDELGTVYNGTIKRSRVFKQSFISKGYGEMKQTEEGHTQALFTTAGEVWINEKLLSEGIT